MCRQFPFLSARTWTDDRVSANFGCPSIQSRLGRAPWIRPYTDEVLIEKGFVKPARDFDAYHRVLRERGLTTRFGEAVQAPAEVPDDLAETVARIRALFPGLPGVASP